MPRYTVVDQTITVRNSLAKHKKFRVAIDEFERDHPTMRVEEVLDFGPRSWTEHGMAQHVVQLVVEEK